MTEAEIENLLKSAIDTTHLDVAGDGSHFMLTIVSEEFVDQSTLKRQQRIYALLNDKITSGEIHALSIKAHSPDEWQTIKEKHNG